MKWIRKENLNRYLQFFLSLLFFKKFNFVNKKPIKFTIIKKDSVKKRLWWYFVASSRFKPWILGTTGSCHNFRKLSSRLKNEENGIFFISLKEKLETKKRLSF